MATINMKEKQLGDTRATMEVRIPCHKPVYVCKVCHAYLDNLRFPPRAHEHQGTGTRP